MRGGLTLKGHGSGRTLKDLPGYNTHAIRQLTATVLAARETFQGPSLAMVF